MLIGCRVGESLLTDMAAISLDDPARVEEAEMEKAPPVAFGDVVKQQHKWQVCAWPVSCPERWRPLPHRCLLG